MRQVAIKFIGETDQDLMCIIHKSGGVELIQQNKETVYLDVDDFAQLYNKWSVIMDGRQFKPTAMEYSEAEANRIFDQAGNGVVHFDKVFRVADSAISNDLFFVRFQREGDHVVGVMKIEDFVAVDGVDEFLLQYVQQPEAVVEEFVEEVTEEVAEEELIKENRQRSSHREDNGSLKIIDNRCDEFGNCYLLVGTKNLVYQLVLEKEFLRIMFKESLRTSKNMDLQNLNQKYGPPKLKPKI